MTIERGRPRKKKSDRMVTLVVMVPSEMKKALEAQAREDHITTGALVRTILGSFQGDFA